jgi:hypothetical protein
LSFLPFMCSQSRVTGQAAGQSLGTGSRLGDWYVVQTQLQDRTQFGRTELFNTVQGESWSRLHARV